MFSDQLKKERNKAGLSQMALAKLLGVSQQTIWSWEIGRTSPDPEMLRAIADHFNITADYLLGRNKVIQTENLSPERKRLIDEIRSVDDKTIEEMQYFLDYLKSKNKKKGDHETIA